MFDIDPFGDKKVPGTSSQQINGRTQLKNKVGGNSKQNSFEFASSQILKKRPSGGSSPLRTTVCRLPGIFFFFV